MKTLDKYIHQFIPSQQGSPVFLLLHGTGGNELSLLPVAAQLDPNAGILAIRGNVSENGMARYFQRLAEGVFDEEEVMARAQEFAVFLQAAYAHYEIVASNVIALGYSNGANFAAVMLLLHPDLFQRAILLRPMQVIKKYERAKLKRSALILAGKRDMIAPPESVELLQGQLEAAGTSVEVHWVDAGHELSGEDVEEISRWLRR